MLRFAYFVELTWLLVDMFSGYLQNQDVFLPGNQTVSALVRVAVVFLCLRILLHHAAPKRSLILALLLTCAIWMSVHLLVDGLRGENNVVSDGQLYLKLMLPVLLFGTLQVQLERGALDAARIRCIIHLNALVLIFNLSLGLFGIGFGNYGESESGELIGSKGFFYAGNEISAALVAIFALVMFVHRERFKRHSLQLLGVCSVFFVTSLMSLSKTSLLGFSLVLVFATSNYLSHSSKVKFGMAFTAVLLVTTPYWLPLIQVSIERWQYFSELRPDVLDFLTSGRIERIENYVAWLTRENIPLHVIFGDGQKPVGTVASFENDLLDLTMASGILGLLFYSIWAVWALSGLRDRIRHKVPEGAFTFYVIGMFIVLSVVAGHVIYSATLAPFIALLALASDKHFPGTAASSSLAVRR